MNTSLILKGIEFNSGKGEENVGVLFINHYNSKLLLQRQTIDKNLKMLY
jgi:hypothetical protein